MFKSIFILTKGYLKKFLILNNKQKINLKKTITNTKINSHKNCHPIFPTLFFQIQKLYNLQEEKIFIFCIFLTIFQKKTIFQVNWLKKNRF